MRRRLTVTLSLLVAWSCYGLVMVTLADQEAGRCLQFGELAGECAAPFTLFFGVVLLLFLAATIVLSLMALRVPRHVEEK